MNDNNVIVGRLPRTLGPAEDIPLPVLLDDGSVRVISVPRMSAEALEFFRRQLGLYERAIVLPIEKPAEPAQ